MSYHTHYTPGNTESSWHQRSFSFRNLGIIVHRFHFFPLQIKLDSHPRPLFLSSTTMLLPKVLSSLCPKHFFAFVERKFYNTRKAPHFASQHCRSGADPENSERGGLKLNKIETWLYHYNNTERTVRRVGVYKNMLKTHKKRGRCGPLGPSPKSTYVGSTLCPLSALLNFNMLVSTSSAALLFCPPATSGCHPVTSTL